MYLTSIRNEPGCLVMQYVINDFLQKDYQKGLIFADGKYERIQDLYEDRVDKLREVLENKIFDFEEETHIDFVYDEEKNEILEKILEKDRKYPYEGIEELAFDEERKIQLANLTDQVQRLQSKIHEAGKAEEAYKNQSTKDDRDDFDIEI